MNTESHKIAKLEQQIMQLIRQNAELNQRLSLLERENRRRGSEITQIASAVNRLG